MTYIIFRLILCLVILFLFDFLLAIIPYFDDLSRYYKEWKSEYEYPNEKKLESFYTLLNETDMNALMDLLFRLMNKDETTMEENNLIIALEKIIKKYEETHTLNVSYKESN